MIDSQWSNSQWRATAVGEDYDFNRNPSSLKTVKSLADKRKIKYYANLIVIWEIPQGGDQNCIQMPR